jgi:alpha-L-rhamnosidase
MLTGGGMNSHNHPMLGSIGSWLIRRVAGIMVDEQLNLSDLKRFILKPMSVPGLDQAQASLDTPWGSLSLSWRRLEDSVEIEATVPWNSCALLKISDSEEYELVSGLHTFQIPLLVELNC